MEEIVFNRLTENYSIADFQLVIENRTRIQIANGETKKIQVDKLPIQAYVKQGWVRSKRFTIDHETKTLNLKNEKVKNKIAPVIGALVLVSLLPRIFWNNSPFVHTISMTNLSLLALWIVYAFVIKRKNWILIEKIETL